jgi:hypothetical protein
MCATPRSPRKTRSEQGQPPDPLKLLQSTIRSWEKRLRELENHLAELQERVASLEHLANAACLDTWAELAKPVEDVARDSSLNAVTQQYIVVDRFQITESGSVSLNVHIPEPGIQDVGPPGPSVGE